jgi:hypothetical protein
VGTQSVSDLSRLILTNPTNSHANSQMRCGLLNLITKNEINECNICLEKKKKCNFCYCDCFVSYKLNFMTAFVQCVNTKYLYIYIFIYDQKKVI